MKQIAGRSVVTECESGPPMKLLAPDSGAPSAWVYQSSLGGGFVGADALSISVEVGDAATLFLSSQASSRVYREAQAKFSLEAHVGAGATLISWPDPVACFAGASLRQTLRFSLAPGARLLAIDSYSAGRVARGERWAFSLMDLQMVVEREGRTVLQDGVRLDPAHGDLAARLGPFECFATVVAVGLELPEIGSFAVSRWPWGAVCRVAAASAAELGDLLQSALGTMATAQLGDDPFARKW